MKPPDQPSLFDWKPTETQPALEPVPEKHVAPLLGHELWPSLRPHLRVERSARHRRVEVASTAPADLVGLARQVTVECAACEAPIFPFRARQGPSGRGEKVGHLYVSVACPLEVKVGCSRGRAAKEATLALVAAVEQS